MIFSITERCNLHCKGCYAQALHKNTNSEMSDEKIRKVMDESRELGISFMVIAGGEPLIRPGVVNILNDYPEIIFLLFTNGLLINDKLLDEFCNQKNVVPIISLEGYEQDTDTRRGKGVYKHLEKVMTKLNKSNVFFGTSVTLTNTNLDSVINDNFIKKLVDTGCKMFFFLEYTPIAEGTEDLIVTNSQRKNIMELILLFRKKYRGLFIAVPGDEEDVGGCMSAGRGFVHLSAEGNMEPYSDTNLNDMSLKDALQSEFLQTIRDNHDKLTETEGGCVLWIEREWVSSLLQHK